ncbi:DUF6378 domain-containing protein [Paracoccaceae bacterium GXU_MW_L88]
MDIKETLEERKVTHGSFVDNSEVSQAIKRIIHTSTNGDTFTSVQNEALEMIAHKISRICAGNPNEIDHWRDIAGYASLVADELEKTQAQ